jgi:hypothetical protein
MACVAGESFWGWWYSVWGHAGVSFGLMHHAVCELFGTFLYVCSIHTEGILK